MAKKTFYPTMKRMNGAYLKYLDTHLEGLVETIGGPTTSYHTDLVALITALQQIEFNWPAYKELP